jgi:hypothetical protein
LWCFGRLFFYFFLLLIFCHNDFNLVKVNKLVKQNYKNT